MCHSSLGEMGAGRRLTNKETAMDWVCRVDEVGEAR